MAQFENLILDEERALYGLRGAQIKNCVFDGPADGESAIKECADITVENCDFKLRYPLWHVSGANITASRMAPTCRAALWYDKDVRLRGCELNGIKALRECEHTEIADCRIESSEFGWFCRGLSVTDTQLVSEYPFLRSSDITMRRFTLTGKYSFQYVENAVLENCVLNTKDAFWHCKNVTVKDSVINGEYLAWYSENLRLIRCKISGTQPLCYAKGLVLEDCEMEGADFSFENSEVTATIKGDLISVKNPISGKIVADHIGEIIWDEHRRGEAPCEIITRG